MNYTEDAQGNRDTLTLGYDPLASYGIDTLFNESNMISTPLDEVFDVRVTDWWDLFDSSISPISVKKQIVCKNWICLPEAIPIISIEIKAKNWPVTASWDNTLFNDSSRNGSFLTSINPGGWWDTGSPSNLGITELEKRNQVTFSSQVELTWNGHINDNYANITNNGDTTSVFWLSFGDSTFFLTRTVEKSSELGVTIFPIPTLNYLLIKGLSQDMSINKVRLFDLMGREYQMELADNLVDISRMAEGVYYISLTLQDGQTIIKKVIKE